MQNFRFKKGMFVTFINERINGLFFIRQVYTGRATVEDCITEVSHRFILFDMLEPYWFQPGDVFRTPSGYEYLILRHTGKAKREIWVKRTECGSDYRERIETLRLMSFCNVETAR